MKITMIRMMVVLFAAGLLSSAAIADGLSRDQISARADLIASQEHSDQGVSVIVDAVDSGRVATLFYEPTDVQASALSFILKYPAGLQVDTTTCLQELPDGFQGGCRASNGELRVILYHPSNAPLPATLLGSVIFLGEKSSGGRRAAMASGREGQDFVLENVDIGEAR